MGREMVLEVAGTTGSLEDKPGVLLIGCPSVGKRTILSRLLSVDIPEIPNLSSEILCQGWTLETKYYSAELSIWTGHLDKGFSCQKLLESKQLAALVMVFDMSDLSSFLALKDWVTGIDLRSFEILLCIGNKADLVSGHYAHVEYRRHLQKHGESSGDPHPDFWDYGINETESSSLLGNEDPSAEIKTNCMEWCIEQNIEYIEACASNMDFDKCLSTGGDVQGVQRLYGALSAHMWPGMVLKSGNPINFPTTIGGKDSSDESEYEIEYEVLSGGADEPWDSTDNPGPSSTILPDGNTEDGMGDQADNIEAGPERYRGDEAYSAPLDLHDNLTSEAGTERENDLLIQDREQEEAA
ncbi:hypothetical protein KSP39_PZI011455 [Platanthera zijinensis]|uniref:Uncharacterized protein n=1 Tax=Platanthera zijinensis TaxID=2320716 RepID=A0AAP0BIA5_9ASPA